MMKGQIIKFAVYLLIAGVAVAGMLVFWYTQYGGFKLRWGKRTKLENFKSDCSIWETTGCEEDTEPANVTIDDTVYCCRKDPGDKGCDVGLEYCKGEKAKEEGGPSGETEGGVPGIPVG